MSTVRQGRMGTDTAPQADPLLADFPASGGAPEASDSPPATDLHSSLLTLAEVADRLRTTHRFVRRLIAEKRIGYVKVGKFIRVPDVDLEAFLAAGRVEQRIARPR